MRSNVAFFVSMAFVASAMLAVPANASIQNCLAERATPESSIQSTSLAFTNLRGNSAQIYWVDFQGRRRLYRILNPGESYSQQTYAGHVWVITDERSSCLFVVTASASPETVNIF